MSKEAATTQVVLPRELVESVDALVGRRARNKFIADAAADKLARMRLSRLVRDAAGSLADVDIPGWETSEAAAEWVHASRRADERRMDEIRDEQ